jgi:hypothetical protein
MVLEGTIAYVTIGIQIEVGIRKGYLRSGSPYCKRYREKQAAQQGLILLAVEMK